MSDHASNVQSDALRRRDFLKGAAATPALLTLSLATSREIASAAPVSDDADVESCPYGVCAHLGGGEEFDQAPKNLELMKKAGIRWARADFSWNGVEYPENNWHFEHLDTILAKAKQVGIQILPILDYDVPWATPAYKNLDKWLEYVKKTVVRYKDQIRYWEVWNEENLKGFWRDEPNGADYATLLKATYKTIKEVDPNLVVVYGGLAGVPVDYFEKSLDAGAKDAFDVLNIHPYRGGITTRDRIERFETDLRALNVALKKRGLEERPIWITEMGWATPPVFGDLNRRIVAAAIQRLYPDKLPKVAFFYDERYDPASSRPRDDFFNYLPAEYDDRRELASFVDADQLKTISANDVDLLVMPPSETFPSDCFDAVAAFVKDGGTLVLNGGVPLYYASTIDPKTGKYRQAKDNPNFGAELEKLRISWYAWWTRENTPEGMRASLSSESLDFKPTRGKNAFEGFYPVYDATRFFDDKALKEGDRMISLLEGRDESFCGVSACIYDFNSDYKGAIVVNSVGDHDGTSTNVATVAGQAIFLPQAYLLAFAFGIERFFWYEFQAPQRDMKDPEHHFGIVGQKLDPKPAYHAYQAMTKARPSGSTQRGYVLDDDLVMTSWDRPDGKKGWALWSSRTTKTRTIAIKGAVEQAFDYLGNDVATPTNNSKITLSPGVLYLVGADEITLS